MRILLVRHGLSEGNINLEKYLELGDQNINLANEGWQQAIKAGLFLKTQYAKLNKWPTIYVSPYLRTKQTLSGIIRGMGNGFPGTPKIFEDPRLIEKHFGATNLLDHPNNIISPEFAAQFKAMSDAIYNKDPFTTRNPLGESNKDNLLTIKTFIDGTLDRRIKAGDDDILIITHGATIKNFLLSWAHLPMMRRDDIPHINNCDVISINGETKNWNITKIYDGETAQKTNINPLNDIKPYGFDDLPPVPPHLM